MKVTHRIVVLFGGSVLLVALGIVVSFWAFRQIKETAAARKHSYIVINRADEFMSAMKDAETGQRGYLLTGDESFLELYLAVRNSMNDRLMELREITLISAAHKHLDALDPLTIAKLAEMSRVIELRRNQDMTAVVSAVGGGQGMRLMDAIRAEIQGFRQIEESALAQHDTAFQSNMRHLFVLIAIAGVLALLLALAFACLIYRESQQRVKNLVLLETQHLLAIQKETNRQLQQANVTLQVSEEKLAVTLHSIGDAVIATDAEERVTLLNPLAEHLTGWTQAEAAGRPVGEIFHIINQETRQPATIPVRETLALGAIHGLANHTILIARDGRECAIADSCAPIRGGDGQVVGAVLVFRDVTKEYAAQQALREKSVELESARAVAERANLAKSEFLSSMSHELRSPLNAILGFAQLMESDSPPPTHAQMERVAQILQAGWHLLTLINEILDLSVIESGKVSLSRESVSLTEVMTECQAMMAPLAQQHGVSMTFPQFEPDTPLFVKADRTRLKQVIINLLSNAIKYNKEQGTVIVSCAERDPAHIRISVADTGEGLPPDKLAQLFQPFNRLGQEAGSVAGTGIGLVVTKRLAELMEGVLGVESTVGVGSVFWCDLMSATAPQLVIESDKAEAVARPQVPDDAPLRSLLYVEDNPANLKLIEQIIARHPDIRLQTAVNGTLGIEIARATLPKVILMDINLPGISGVEALKILRSDPATAHIPVVALSANAMPRDIATGLEAGFFHYLTKPIKVSELLDTLNLAFDSAKRGKV